MSQRSSNTHRSIEERINLGKALRDKVSRRAQAVLKPGRRDPIKILLSTNEGRIPELLPIRFGRMSQSPFAFFRGAAAIMAFDLAKTPVTGIDAQLCGDCHLLNFGGFGTPERRLIFDINDFDETLPGPWEWDLKRLMASIVIAARHNGFSKDQIRGIAMSCSRNYRKYIGEYAEMNALDVWYASIDVQIWLKKQKDVAARSRLRKRLKKIMDRSVAEDDYPKLAEFSGGKHRIRDNPPLIYHPQEGHEASFNDNARETLKGYRETLSDDRRVLFDRYELQDVAIKVVGVGSVGTWCGVGLHMAGGRDPLFLQAKEARASVLEPYLKKSIFPNHGQRIVIGQRLMQSASDIFLGWTKGRNGRHFYVRQLRDMKVKPQVEFFDAEQMQRYAKFCGWGLARAHAKSGDAATLRGYVGKSEALDEALVDFGEAYAAQNERDYQALLSAIRKGKVHVYLER